MKRKRGHKKKKVKKLRIEATNAVDSAELVVESPNNDNNGDDNGGGSTSDEEIDYSNGGDDDEKPVVVAPPVAVRSETPPPPLKEPERLVTIRPDGVIHRPPPTAVYGRVRVKLKTAAKPPTPQPIPQPQSQPVPKPEPEPQVQPIPEHKLQLQPLPEPELKPQPEPKLVEAKVADEEEVSNGSEGSRQEVSVEKKEESGDAGSGSAIGEKVVEESKNSTGKGIKIVLTKNSSLSPSSRNAKESGEKAVEESEERGDGDSSGGSREKVVDESKKSTGKGIKITLSNKSSLSPPSGNAKESGGSGEKAVEESDERGDGGGCSGSGEKVVEESGNSVSLLKSMKSRGAGIKIVSAKNSSLSPPGGNEKESDDSGSGMGERVVEESDKHGDGSSDEMVVEESGNLGSLLDSKKSRGTGIKIVSAKSTSLSTSGGIAKERAGSGSGEKVVEESDKHGDGGSDQMVVEESGNSGSLLDSKKLRGTGIKIVSAKSSSLSPPGGIAKESSGSGSGSGEKVVEGSDERGDGGTGSGSGSGCGKGSDEMVVEESGNSGSLLDSKQSRGTGIKIVSAKNPSLSPTGWNIKERDDNGDKVVGESDDRADGGSGSGSENGSDEMVVEESGHSGSLLDSSKLRGTGIKIVSAKSSSLSSPGGNSKEKGGSGSGEKVVELIEERGDGVSGSGKDSDEKVVEESGKSGSLPESKKSGGTGIKIVSAKSLSVSPPGGNAKEIVSAKSSSLSSPGGNAKESGGSRMSPGADEEDGEEVEKRKPKSLNKQELEVSLEVIKKVMKMDAAEPFNKPVDPIALGIPDYFDVIDTPMDFGTICSNLERGAKYLDSEDVYKDVQYIWDNCFKYNNKGDYIVDLMKRVKKNFMKYWVAAGLYSEQTKKMIDGESPAADEPTTSGPGRKLKKGKGFKRHKDDCLCAVCIMKRRRQEREAREAREAQEARESGVIASSPQIRVPQPSMPEEYKNEEKSHAESPGDYTSSYMETSPNGDADAEMEDGEIRDASQYDDQQKARDDEVEFYDRSGDISEKSQHIDKGDIELYSHVEPNLQDDTGSRMMIDAQEQPSIHPQGPSPGYLQQRHEMLELEKRQRLRLLETFRDLENPMLSELCGTLFPNNAHSVWTGANSLLQRQRSSRQKTDIHEAIASFVDPSYKSASSLK